MPDYIYLLANRLSPSQQNALQSIRDAAREAGMTVFLTGGAVRDLTSGSPVRDLDLSVQGNALELKPQLKAAGAVLWGEHVPSQTIFARFPGSVRVEVSSTRREEFPKPGKPVYHPGNILEDLRRRDFTANAMALSLNEGSFGLLMDPLNGVADLEARLLRLVSNYGFIEDPIRLVRASRLKARMGWELEEKTQTRYDNAKEEGMIAQIPAYQQGYEVEEIIHEEDGLKILRALEADGWMKAPFPAWTSAKANVESLDAMREVLTQLQMQGVNPDPSAAQAELLTSKLAPKDIAALKKLFVRKGFVLEWESQDDRAKEFGKRLIGKEAAVPSAAWKLLTSTDPEALLWLGLTSKTAAVQEKLKEFFSVWPEARQRIPYAIMQEMRITPELEGYQDLLKKVFFELIDGKLTTDEEIRQFLEPYSPPAPPPPVSIRRTRSKRLADKNREAKEEQDDGAMDDVRPSRVDEDGEEIENDDDSGAGDEHVELVARDLTPRIAAPPPLPVPSPATASPLTSSTPPKASPSTKFPKSGGQVANPKPETESKPVSVAVTTSVEKVAAPVIAPAPVKKAVIPVARPVVKAEVKLAAKPEVKAASKSAPPNSIKKTAAKAATHNTAKTSSKGKSALKAKLAKPVKRVAIKKVATKKVATKRVPVKHAQIKHALAKRPPVRKLLVKVAAKSKLHPAPVKKKPAKAIVKAKPAQDKVKPTPKPVAAKTKQIAKSKANSRPSPKSAVKAAAKAAPLKKKR